MAIVYVFDFGHTRCIFEAGSGQFLKTTLSSFAFITKLWKISNKKVFFLIGDIRSTTLFFEILRKNFSLNSELFLALKGIFTLDEAYPFQLSSKLAPHPSPPTLSNYSRYDYRPPSLITSLEYFILCVFLWKQEIKRREYGNMCVGFVYSALVP